MCCQWINDKIKKFTCSDYAVLKIGVFAFALLAAKLWLNILSLDWYWYALVYAAAVVYFIVRIFKK